VAAGNRNTFLIGDLPFGSYQESPEQAMRSATALMQAGAQMVKLEGGGWTAETVRFLVDRGVPVCAHLGLTPQSVHALGGHRVQGRDDKSAARLKEDARALEDAGAFAIVLELVPAPLAAEVSKALTIPTIGIGAGPGCDGQVLVLPDMLGLNDHFNAKFVKRYGDLAAQVRDAATRFAAEVRAGKYPDADHSFQQ
jgi:3-methyl-2-oxobutanoate hydroxymethyltransferase